MKWINLFWYSLLLCVFNGAIVDLFAQTTISGTIIDSEKNPIPFATIALLHSKDSSIVAHSVSDVAGKYSMECHQLGMFRMEVRCLGYVHQIKEVELNGKTSSMTLNYSLETGSIALPSVAVHGKAVGVQVKDDTIRYYPQVFTDGSELVLDDIIKKLPGINVDQHGNIQAQGKDVKRILVNGRDFFSENTQLATKNIPADAVENIDVLKNYSEYSLFEGFQSHEETVLNVGVKPKFRS